MKMTGNTWVGMTRNLFDVSFEQAQMILWELTSFPRGTFEDVEEELIKLKDDPDWESKLKQLGDYSAWRDKRINN